LWRIAQGLRRFVFESPEPFVVPANAMRAVDTSWPFGDDSSKQTELVAFLAKHFGGVVGHGVERPIGTITARDHHALVTSHLVKLRGECHSAAAAEPAPTVTAAGTHLGEVRAFLTTYYGNDGTPGCGSDLRAPMRTLRAKNCMGLVTVHGYEYQLVDVGMRMLEPHELLKAQFGRFAEDYDLRPACTKSAQVRLIGNSVCPELAEQVVRANLSDSRAREAA
jgi:DNA (cytosine-5)-methyltransferase 1